MLASFLCREFLLHIPCCGYCFCCCFCLFVVVFIWGVSLTHLMLFKTSKQKTGGSFSYISRAGFFSFFFFLFFFFFLSFLSADFLLHISCWLHFCLGSFSYTPSDGFIFLRGFSYISRAGFIFIWVASLTYPMLVSFLFHLWSFSYTSRAGFFFCG